METNEPDVSRLEGLEGPTGRRRWSVEAKAAIVAESFLPGDLEAQIEAFVGRYNHRRCHESLKNLTPADVYARRGQTIRLEREKTKRATMKQRRWLWRR